MTNLIIKKNKVGFTSGFIPHQAEILFIALKLHCDRLSLSQNPTRF